MPQRIEAPAAAVSVTRPASLYFAGAQITVPSSRWRLRKLQERNAYRVDRVGGGAAECC